MESLWELPSALFIVQGRKSCWCSVTLYCCYGCSSQYTGTGYVGRGGVIPASSFRANGTTSKPNSGHSTHSYGATYGYGSPGTVPLPRGRGSGARPANSGSHVGGGGGGGGMSSAGRFCYDCGAKFPTPNAKFCCECGMARHAWRHRIAVTWPVRRHARLPWTHTTLISPSLTVYVHCAPNWNAWYVARNHSLFTPMVGKNSQLIVSHKWQIHALIQQVDGVCAVLRCFLLFYPLCEWHVFLDIDRQSLCIYRFLWISCDRCWQRVLCTQVVPNQIFCT